MARKNKMQANFRFYEETINQLNFLAEKLERDRTDIVELAINYLCDTYRKTAKCGAPVPRYSFDIDHLLKSVEKE